MIKRNMIPICFIAGLFILLALASYAVSPDVDEVYDIISVREKLYEINHVEKDTIDVLFTGDSLVFRDISPLRIWKDTGITSYDLSQGAMRLCDQYVMIKNVCRRQDPSLLVLEADVMTQDASPYKDDFALPTNLIEKYLPIFHYHTFYKAFHPFEDDDSYLLTRNRGYDPVDGIEPYEGPGDYMNTPAEPFEIGLLNLKYLEFITDYCEKNDITLLVLALPSPGNYNSEVCKAIRAWSDANNAEFLDMNPLWEDIGIDWSQDTKDGGDHMNPSGAEKVSRFLGEYLEENYDLTDHRNDEAYDNWNRDYDKLYN